MDKGGKTDNLVSYLTWTKGVKLNRVPLNDEKDIPLWNWTTTKKIQ
jgi:hypothetical protein